MSVGWGQVHLEIQNVDTNEGILDIYMQNSIPVTAFQFNLSGLTITEVFGGLAEEFDILDFSSETGGILGYAFTQSDIPIGEGILLHVSFNDVDDEICFVPNSNIFSDITATEIPSSVGECYSILEIFGCTYPQATNYNPEATHDDGSCDFMWGDVNHDGQLTIQDLILIVNEILNF